MKKVEHKIGYIFPTKGRICRRLIEYQGDIQYKCSQCALAFLKECEKTACKASERKDAKEVYVKAF